MNNNTFDPFEYLRAIDANQTTPPPPPPPPPPLGPEAIKFWIFRRDGNIMGKIIGFGSFEHPQFGEQHTITVQLADTNELISAFLNGYLQEGMRRKDAQVGDLILIQFLGKQPGERFNRYRLEIDKNLDLF